MKDRIIESLSKKLGPVHIKLIERKDCFGYADRTICVHDCSDNRVFTIPQRWDICDDELHDLRHLGDELFPLINKRAYRILANRIIDAIDSCDEYSGMAVILDTYVAKMTRAYTGRRRIFIGGEGS
jgi:hypothetical protein